MSSVVILPDTTRIVDANSADVNSGGHRAALFFLDIDAVTGASPTVDVKLQAKSPNGDYVDIPGGAFAQKTSAGTSMLSVGLGLTAAANVAVNQLLPDVFRAVAAMGTVNATNEVQTIDLDDVDNADTFKIATGAAGTAKTGTLTYTDANTGADMAALMQTALNLVYGASSVAVVAVDADTFTVTFSGPLVAATNVVQMQITDAVGFTPLATGGYTLGVITTTPGVVTDSWNGSLTASLL